MNMSSIITAIEKGILILIVALTLGRRSGEASTFIWRKLLEFFLYDEVHDSMVDQLATRLRQNTGDHLQPMVETHISAKLMKGIDTAHLGVGRCVDQFIDPGIDQSAGAHRAWLKCHRDRAADQAPGAECL